MDLDFWTRTVAQALADAGLLAADSWRSLHASLPGWEQMMLRPQVHLPEAAPGDRETLLTCLDGKADLGQLADLVRLAAQIAQPEQRATLTERWQRLDQVAARATPPATLALPITGDTRPVEEDLLLSFQREARDRISGWLKDLRRPSPEPPQRPRLPVPVLEANRTHQVVLIDGDRGTGKTALLLTLVEAWLREVKAGRPAEYLPIALLDYDPMPRDLGVYPWLVIAFQRWAESLDPSTHSKDWRCTDEPGLRQLWNDLYRKALLGWSRRADLAAESREQGVAARREADGGWQDLHEEWVKFIDALIKEAMARRHLADDGLLILGIDDLDLNDCHAGQLLLALRLLRHPRLVVVLTGDKHHLERVLTRELWQESSSGGRLVGELGRAAKADAGQLARALIQKTLPQIQSMRRLTLLDALRLASGRSASNEQALQAWLAKACVPLGTWWDWGQDLTTWLTDARREPGEAAFTVRSVVQALGLGATTPLPPVQQLKRLLAAATRSDGAPLLGTIDQLGVRVGPRLAVTFKGEKEAQSNEVVEFALRAGLFRPAIAVWERREQTPVVFSEIGAGLRRRALLEWPMPATHLHLADALAQDRCFRRRAPWAGGRGRLTAWLEVVVYPPYRADYWQAPPAQLALEALLNDEATRRPELMAWVRDELPVLAAPEYELDPGAAWLLVAVSWRLCREVRRDWKSQCDQLDERREQVVKESLAEGDTISHLAPNHPARLPAPWHEYAPDAPWYQRKLSFGKTALDLIRGLPTGWPTNLPFRDYAGLFAHQTPPSDSHPTWASRALTDDADRSRAVRGAFEAVNQETGDLAALRFFVRAWQVLCGFGGAPKGSKDWFDVTSTGGGLAYRGPPLALRARLGKELRVGVLEACPVVGWEVVSSQGSRLPWPEALVGWFGIMQSLLVLSRDGTIEAEQPILVEEPRLLRRVDEGDSNPDSGPWSWLRADFAAEWWREFLDVARSLVVSEPPLAISHYLEANWLVVQAASRGSSLRSGYSYPVDLDDIEHLARNYRRNRGPAAAWVWLQDDRMPLDDGTRAKWRRGIAIDPPRNRPPATPLIERLPSLYELREAVPHMARAIHQRLVDTTNPVRTFAELREIPGMDDWTFRCLEAWADLQGT